jgi:3-hydroxy-9,10-secoandrosta-1,3,5(10)-triene-9,17-dione monooxygenase
MLETMVPTREELVRRTSDLVPLLRERAQWIDANRRLPDDVIEAMADAGLFKMRAPVQYGGYESDARTLNDVHAEVARGDGSAAFCLSVWSLINWLVGRFPDHVQDEVFATPDVRVCGSISPTGTVRKVDGGYLYDGSWKFTSGALHSQWKFTAGMMDTPDGPQAMTALVPMSDLRIVDDWHVAGMRGTGSVTTVAENLFVPEERVVPQLVLFSPECQSETNASKPVYNVPLLVTSTAATAGQTVGAARYALESFLERLPGKKMTYTEYPSQRDAPVTHLQVGEAALLAEEAEVRARTFAERIDDKSSRDEPWSEEERVESRVSLGRTAQLAKQAVDILATASGASGVYDDVPIQRIQRNLHVMSIHALTMPSTNIELYGRMLCGLPPNTLFL